MEIIKPSEMEVGAMFICTFKEKPEVYVKTGEGEVQGVKATIFIKNSALVKHLISNYEPSCFDQWAMRDDYYVKSVESGAFIPISDIKEVAKYYPDYKMDEE